MALVNIVNEYGVLRSVVMYRPSESEIAANDAAGNMYLETPNPKIVLEQFDALAESLRLFGVQVYIIENDGDNPETSNMIYLRDVAVVLDDKIVPCRMRHEIRSSEPQKFVNLTRSQFPELASFIVDPLGPYMEGADILRKDKDGIFAYFGNRTEERAGDELSRIFPGLDVKQINANIRSVPQHILGGMHIISSQAATVRSELVETPIENYRLIHFAESAEIVHGLSLNTLTLAPNTLLMPANCPITKGELERQGVTCFEVDVSEIQKMGGGISCTVLPIARGGSR